MARPFTMGTCISATRALALVRRAREVIPARSSGSHSSCCRLGNAVDAARVTRKVVTAGSSSIDPASPRSSRRTIRRRVADRRHLRIPARRAAPVGHQSLLLRQPQRHRRRRSHFEPMVQRGCRLRARSCQGASQLPEAHVPVPGERRAVAKHEAVEHEHLTKHTRGLKDFAIPRRRTERAEPEPFGSAEPGSGQREFRARDREHLYHQPVCDLQHEADVLSSMPEQKDPERAKQGAV